MWHLTLDTWHMTCNMWHVEGCELLSKSQIPSSYGLELKVFWRGSLTDLMNKWISNEGDCRRAPATSGLLNIPKNVYIYITKKTLTKSAIDLRYKLLSIWYRLLSGPTSSFCWGVRPLLNALIMAVLENLKPFLVRYFVFLLLFLVISKNLIHFMGDMLSSPFYNSEN